MPYYKPQPSIARLVTPSDTVNIPQPSGPDGKNEGCVLYVGTSGNLRVLTAGGDDVVFTAVPVGFFPVQVIRVFATNTAASNIVALW